MDLNLLAFTLLLALASMAAGFLGSLTGLGGGVVLVPLLVLVFGVDIHYAIGASLVSVIATSSGAAAAYVKEGYSNIRVGMFLEVATTTGAIVGAFVAAYVEPRVLAIIFGVVLLMTAYLSVRPRRARPDDDRPSTLATKLRLDGTYPTPDGLVAYHVHGVPFGFIIMFIAGALSGLLGIGSGALKVLAMDQGMRIPFKVSTTTSNFMIGVTAAASAGVYLNRGYIDPVISLPVMLGVLAGSMLGAMVLMRVKVRWLRIVFGIVIVAMALQMIYNGVFGGL